MKRRDLIKTTVGLSLVGTGRQAHSAEPNKQDAKHQVLSPAEYDFIIVGGGTAGPVIATRLSENPTVSVLLIEAGKENTKEGMHYVNGVGEMWAPDTNWGYNSTPQGGLKDRKIMLPRGKVVGGCASINVGSWSRGCAANYDSWGLKGWDWDSVLPWYRKIEGSERGGHSRGSTGPMKLEDTPKGTYMTDILRQAAIETGVGATDDLNGESNEGFNVWECIFRDGRRHNTVVNYLDKARNRSNLTIMTETYVSKVLLENKVAVGVACSQGENQMQIKAKREVILCAGTYATPKVLMLSGIGPAKDLDALGITVHHNLPGVGKNLGDHLRTDFGVQAPEGVGVSLRGNMKDPVQLAEWRRTGYGPLSVAENTSTAFVKSSPDVPVADIELMFNINAQMQWGKPPPKNNGYYINVGLVQPVSRGEIRLASNNPKDRLVVDPNYLGDEQDMKHYIAGMRIAMKFPRSQALQAYTDLSTVSISLEASDQEIADYIRSRAESIYHPVGTSKMGTDGDPSAVVNTKLQVHGIKGLRVADASILPNLITGHTMAPTVLVAERAADFITSEG